MTKVVVLNVSGNTGKTTLSKHLLAPPECTASANRGYQRW